MTSKNTHGLRVAMSLATVAASALLIGAAPVAAPLPLARLTRIAKVDERYQSYNIEMVEVTGGRFWAPYGGPANEIYRQRPPLDLTDTRLIAYAKNLAPAYLRVSGTWANNTYLPTADEHLAEAPAGFKQLLQRQEWRNVVALSKAADAPIVTSFAVSTGTRGPDGLWTPVQAQRVADLTREAGGHLAAAEMFNEPNMPGAAQPMPAGYVAANYAADFRLFHDWARKAVPDMKIIGPGGVGEGGAMKAIPVNAQGETIHTEDILAANAGKLDVVTYHFYGTVSQRCAAMHGGSAVKADALSPAWLDRTLGEEEYYSGLRDKYEPGKPLWNTETAQAACGGSPWAATFLDTFRYLGQLGLLAQRNVQVVMHNTLATSDYALINRDTMVPRPNYWAAVLWRRVMGTVVLTPPASPSPRLRLYAQCLRGVPGGVAILALNTGEEAQTLRIAGKSQAWIMTGKPVDTGSITINGHSPALAPDGTLTGMESATMTGPVAVPPQSIAFVAVPQAANPACG